MWEGNWNHLIRRTCVLLVGIALLTSCRTFSAAQVTHSTSTATSSAMVTTDNSTAASSALSASATTSPSLIHSSPHPTTTTATAVAADHTIHFGVDINFFDENLRSTQARLQALHEVNVLGATWVRSGLGLGWNQVEPTVGVWNFTAADATVAAFQAHHLHMLAELGSTPSWAAAPGNGASYNLPPKDPQQFAVYAGKVAAHFRGQISAYKIYNEPQNVPAWSPHLYAEVFALAAQAIHAADPRALVMPGGFWFAGGHTAEFQRALFADPQYPMGRYVDVINLHMTRTSPASTQRWLHDAHRFMAAFHLNLPIWVDEFAYPSVSSVQWDPAYRDGEASQAAYYAAILTIMAADPDVRGIFCTYLVDEPKALRPIERYLGIMRDGFIPKPSFTVYQQFIVQHRYPSTATPPASGVYRVEGKRIIDFNGATFIPYGVQVPSLWVDNWRHNTGMQQNAAILRQQTLYATIHTVWHANTISLQLASADLFDEDPYDQAYLDLVDQVVAMAHAAGMATLIVLQYESTTRKPLPTADSVHFWHVLAAHYQHEPWVFFDIFNEPRNPQPGPDDGAAWQRWQSGGVAAGVSYVGMQAIIDTIRQAGSQNLIFVDGLAAGEDLNGVPTHLLHGGNIVYAVHPYFNATQHATPVEWDRWFGTIARTGDFPVVADEWGEYQSSTHGECLPQAPTLVPQFLAYVRLLHIGLIAYGLYPGILIRGWDFKKPTAFDQPSYTCPPTSFPNMDPQAQGIGQLLIAYFARYSH
jgi:hypothetical protein